MTVVKGDVDVWKNSVMQFISPGPRARMMIALIPPLPIQMQKRLANFCSQLVSDQESPIPFNGLAMTIPTSDTEGKLHCDHDFENQRYRVSLQLDNYIVTQTIPESAYV